MFYKKKIVLDIETTGLDLEKNDKIIEICCLEIKNRSITNNIFHTYLNPNKLINQSAYNIHGISNEFLIKKPIFSEIALDFINFISNSKIIIHNAPFDLSFINKELKSSGFKNVDFYSLKIIDTLKISKKLFPNKRNSLDFLCKRLNINVNRVKHSALLDCKLLAEVYLTITRKQNKLIFKKNKKNKKIFKYTNDLVLKAGPKDLFKHNNFFKKSN